MASKTGKPYWEMTLAELREATKEFDRPIPLSKMRPLTKAQRERFERMQSGGSRSILVKRSAKTQTVQVELDDELLQRSSRYASRHKMSLSDVINKSLRSALNFVE
jgi:hypothetical protein